jgi:Uma2 family endonuclease
MGQAPDLVIEILSPGQTVKALSSRLSRCLAQGVRLAWLVQPSQRRVFVFRPGHPPETLGIGDELLGEGVLPGFRLPLAEMFGWLAVGSKPFPA